MKVVITNLVPESCKVLMFVNKHKLKASEKHLETLLTSSKYKYEQLMKQNGFGIAEEMYTKVQISKKQRPFLKPYCENLARVRDLYQQIIKDTLKLRYDIFAAMAEFQRINDTLNEHFELEQIGRFIECTRNIKSGTCSHYITHEKVNVFSIWDIKRKDYSIDRNDQQSEEDMIYSLTDSDDDQNE